MRRGLDRHPQGEGVGSCWGTLRLLREANHVYVACIVQVWTPQWRSRRDRGAFLNQWLSLILANQLEQCMRNFESDAGGGRDLIDLRLTNVTLLTLSDKEPLPYDYQRATNALRR